MTNVRLDGSILLHGQSGGRSRNVLRRFLIVAWLMPHFLLSASMAGDDNPASVASRQQTPQKVTFSDHVQPILNKHCISCHGGVKQAGEVSFVYRDQVLPPDGWVVEPGDPENSILLQRVLETDLDLRMPPPDHGAALAKEEIDTLRRWIQQGAIWEGGHWAYTTPTLPDIPAIQDADWPRNHIDAFVLRRLEQEGMHPSADAAADRWLRRITLDLIGLPPTLEQRSSFLAAFAQSPTTAKEAVVDKLLASPGFGERWASVWLDQVRYADSRGLGVDGRRTIWKFRDWVIDAINSNMPFDEFTVRQLAGDLLPNPTISDYVATAAHRVTQSNEEGGTDDEEFRVAAVLDRVNTTWQAWQGVTFGCVQCHSHPYDPFRHEEYYRFAAFFNNTQDVDLNEDYPTISTPLDAADYGKATELEQQRRRLRKKIWDREFEVLNSPTHWSEVTGLDASTNKKTRVVSEQRNGQWQFHTVDTVQKNTDITLDVTLPDNLDSITAIRFTGMPLDPNTAVSDSEWGFALSHVEAMWVSDEDDPLPLRIARLVIDEPEPFFDPQESLKPKSNRGFAAFSRIHHSRHAAFILETPFECPPEGRLRIVLKHRVHILASFSLITRRGTIAVSDADEFTQLLTDNDLLDLRERLAQVEQQRKSIKSVQTPVLAERPQHLRRPTHVFERGLFLTKAQKVEPGTPESLPPLPDAGVTDRLKMARWLVSDENPLTARVLVNRVWARLFGTGLVATEEDFGSSGELPSHPELLDFLAVRFRSEQQWKLKALLKEIVLSRTYGQSAKATSADYTNDQANRLLARGPRYRLSSEIVRDQALAVSGLLSPKMHGPPVHPPIPGGVWKPFQGGDKWSVPEVGNEDRYRRSIYTYTKRSIPYPMFAAFDAPSREFCTSRRLRSNTPLQALMMLNDQTFAECTSALASRMSAHSSDLTGQLAFGFLLVTSREAHDDELKELVRLHSEIAGDDLQSDELDTQTAANTRGMQAVARLLLNLDEVVMK